MVRYPNMFALMADLRGMGATNPLTERLRRPASRGLLMRAARIYEEKFGDKDGRVRATFEIVWLLGWAPHESQQKPLKPGSAKTRLADALGAKEQKSRNNARPSCAGLSRASRRGAKTSEIEFG